CAKPLVFIGFQTFAAVSLATARNASMRGVGTKMGTVLSHDFQSPSRANIGTSGQHGTYKTYKTPRPTGRPPPGVGGAGRTRNDGRRSRDPPPPPAPPPARAARAPRHYQ